MAARFIRLRRALPRLGLGLLLVLAGLGHAASLYRLPFLESLEVAAYDLRLRFIAPGGVDPRIVIVDIDEESLKEREAGGEGRWPWPRDRLALLVDQLFDRYGVALVGFDTVFAERDESSGIRTLESLAEKDLRNNPGYRAAFDRLRPELDFDDRFARSLIDRPVVLGYTFTSRRGDPKVGASKGALAPPVATVDDLPLSTTALPRWSSFTGNLETLQGTATGAGFFNPAVDVDGTIRRLPMLAEFEGAYFESLSLAMIRALSAGEPVTLTFAEGVERSSFGALEGLDVGGFGIPVDEEISALVPFRGPYRSFEYVSAARVIRGEAPVESLEGKIVLVGTTAPGLLDLRPTPVGNAYPGVEIHANMIAGILDGTVLQKPPFAIGADVISIALLGLIGALALPFLGPLASSLWFLMSAAAAIGFNYWLLTSAQLLLPLATLLVTIAALYVFNMAYGFFFESRGKRQITGLFGQYVPPELVDEMAKDPTSYSMEGESRELTVLFSDVRGFTTISEGLDPKSLSQLMNSFLSPLSEVIYGHRGTIDKYMGDAIMAFWGAPVSDEDHARHGIEAAFSMLAKIEALNAEFAARGWPKIQLGIGLNSGRVSVGNMGSKIRLAYTVMGDTVNLASRLEGITKEYGARIVIGTRTRELVPEVLCRELDRVRVKGKDVAVTIFEPICFDKDATDTQRTLVTRFHEALEAYRAQRWDSAASSFAALQAEDPGRETLYSLYLERIAHLREEPPGADWDGAYTFKTK